VISAASRQAPGRLTEVRKPGVRQTHAAAVDGEQLCLSQADAALLHKIIIQLSKLKCPRNPFDCVAISAVRSQTLGFGIIAMLEAVTALFGIMSAGIFVAHAIDGYRSR
jgi:hypothetical protein